jgi:hypothetical protein
MPVLLLVGMRRNPVPTDRARCEQELKIRRLSDKARTMNDKLLSDVKRLDRLLEIQEAVRAPPTHPCARRPPVAQTLDQV